MTTDELQTAKRMLVDALDASVNAARLLRELAEFAAPLVKADPRCIKNAKRTEMQIGYTLHEVRRVIDSATEADICQIFNSVTKG